ncbi:MAG: hypothetical protein AAFR88_11495 [Pseudomonadota bacterium]
MNDPQPPIEPPEPAQVQTIPVPPFGPLDPVTTKARIANLHSLTRRLVILTGVALLIVVSVFGITFAQEERLMISWLVFLCGILGGFVSIQQRVKTISNEELELLANSWFQMLLIPVFGALFSLFLYCIFLAELFEGVLFPSFAIAAPEGGVPDDKYFIDFLQKTYPKTGQDLAKLIVWSFIAGFAERLVPQIISNLTVQITKPGKS